MYKLIKNKSSNQIDTVFRLSDNAFIPFDEGNTDYKQYLEWVAEGNEAEVEEVQ